MNKIVTISTLFLGFFALTLGIGKTLAMGFPMGVDSISAQDRIAKLEKAIAKTQAPYQEALEIMKKSNTSEEKESALKACILKHDDSDILFTTFIANLEKTINKLQNILALPQKEEYETVRKNGKEVLNSFEELHKFIQAMGEKNQVELCAKLFENKYAAPLAMLDANLTVIQQQAELQHILMLSFSPKVAFKYIVFQKELIADIDALLKIKTQVSQQASTEAINEMINKLVILNGTVVQTYCYQQENAAYKRERKLLSRIDSMFHQLRKQRSKLSMLQATYEDTKDLVKWINYMYGWATHRPGVHVVRTHRS